MTEPVFFKRPIGLSVGEIVTLTGATVRSIAHRDRRIYDIAPLDRAGPSDLSFLENSRYLEQLASTRAGACLMADRFADRAPAHVTVLLVREPYRAFVTVARALFADAMRPSSLFDAKGVASGAHVHPSARVENGVTIDPGAVIGPGAEIGAGTVIAATAVVGPQVRIGRDCTIGAAATITHALVGDRVIIHPGCRIGQDGFGYMIGAQGHTKVPQAARVIIQDEVEVGAGATIDRGAIRDTVIGAGTKIDNLVQVGHNVVIGRHCLIVAQTGISGSVMLGDFVVLGARVGINNHVTIGEGAHIAAISIVNDDVPPGARWGGTPAKPVKQWFREMLTLERLAAREDAGERSGKRRDER
jgi:UDP-3-O-[3-hydroxymyristoyl] glucosamine N-acyltransferase